MPAFRSIRQWGARVALVTLALGLLGSNPVSALTTEQRQVLKEGILYYNTEDDITCGSAANLQGSDNEEKGYNYFKSKGLGDVQTAAVIGNLMQESHLNPTDMEIGGDSQNPNDAGAKGWGIAQWTPGGKVINIANSLNITGPIYELATQLDIVWAEMQGTAPTGAQDVADSLKQISDLPTAVTFFQTKFEGGTTGLRQQYAQQALQQYGSGGSGSTVGTTSDAGGCGGSPVNCTTASGNAKILCEAKAYNGIYYRWGGGHNGYAAFTAACPDPSNPPDNQPSGAPPDAGNGGLSGNPSPCATDCSGLVDIAVQAAFGTNLGGVAVSGLESDAKNWKKLPSLAVVQTGDIVVIGTEHVEIVDYYDSGNQLLYTFGSHHTGAKTSEISSSLSNWTGAYRYIGPGSSGT